MPTALKIIFVAGLISFSSWLVVGFRLKRIPRPEGYRGGILRRYQDNFPKSPIVAFIYASSLFFYCALAYWIWTIVTHR